MSAPIFLTVIVTLTVVDLVLILVRREPPRPCWVALAVAMTGLSVLFDDPVASLLLAISALSLGATAGRTGLRSPVGLGLAAGGLVFLAAAGIAGWSAPVFPWYAASATTVAAVVAAIRSRDRLRPPGALLLLELVGLLALAVAPFATIVIGPSLNQWLLCVFLMAHGASPIVRILLSDMVNSPPTRLRLEIVERELRIQEDLTSVGLLSATAAHEVKNGISNLRLAAQHGLDANSREAKDRALTAISDALDGGSGTLVSLLDEMTNREREAPRSVSVLEIVGQAARVARCSGPATRIDCRIPPDLSLVCRPSELRHVLVGLLRNAVVAYGENPGVVHVAAQAVRSDLTIDISDQAGGLPLEGRMVVLGEPNPSGRGGLGLSLITRILGRNGGRLEYGSQPGGTLFRVLIPFRVDTGQTPLL